MRFVAEIFSKIVTSTKEAASQRGASMVEFAAAIFLIVPLLGGVTDISHVLAQRSSLLQAVREGARRGAQTSNVAVGQAECSFLTECADATPEYLLALLRTRELVSVMNENLEDITYEFERSGDSIRVAVKGTYRPHFTKFPIDFKVETTQPYLMGLATNGGIEVEAVDADAIEGAWREGTDGILKGSDERFGGGMVELM